MSEKKLIEDRLGKLIIYFIILSPLIDVSNSLMNRFLDITLGIGMITRGVLILLLFGYLLLNLKKVFNKDIVNYLIIAMFAFIGINFIVNWFQKEPFYLMSEITFIFKTVYFFGIFLFMSLWLKGEKKRIAVLKAGTISAIIYNLFIWVPHYAGVSFDAYARMKDGSVGWFYAANEISALLAILFPFAFFYYLYSKKNREKVSKYSETLSLVAIISFLPSFYIIGTKVSLGIGLIYSSFMAIYFIYRSFKDKKKSKNILLAVLFILELFVLVNSPSVSNTKVHLEKEIVVREPAVQIETTIEQIDYPEPIHPLLTKILSSRDIYIRLHLEYLEEASLERKLFGMGYSSEYDIEPKMIEMDFFDIFFSYGIFFISLFVLFSLTLGKRVVSSVVKEKDKFKKVMILISVALVAGISFLTGHILFAPAVSLFWATLLILVTGQEDN